MLRVICLLVLLLGAVLTEPAAFAIRSPETIQLVDVETRSQELDGLSFEENTPPQAGQRFVFTDALYRWAGTERGRRIGRIEGICTFTNVDPEQFVATSSCQAYIYLPAGQLLVSGFIRFSEESSILRLPVVGGTGRYSNAHGTVTIKELRSGNSALTIRLFPLRRS